MMKPVILFRKDLSTEDEYEIALKYFQVVQHRSDIPAGSLVFGRYSTLPYYKELEYDVHSKLSELVNTHSQYNWIANFDWYEAVKDYTFETWFRAQDLPDDGTQFVVKGRTNSRKHEWNRLMFAHNKQRAIEIMLVLNEDSLIAPQGVVFRRYEPLVTYEIGINGLKFTNEYRCFFYKGKMVSHAYYWTMAENVDRVLPEEGLRFVQEVADIVKEYTNFFVLDIAEKESGGWILVEINDGQMAGLSENTPHNIYGKLSKLIKEEQDGEENQ